MIEKAEDVVVPTPKSGLLSTEFWLVAIVAILTMISAFTGETFGAEQEEVIRSSLAEIVDAIVRLVEVIGPIVLAGSYAVIRGNLKETLARLLKG